MTKKISFIVGLLAGFTGLLLLTVLIITIFGNLTIK